MRLRLFLIPLFVVLGAVAVWAQTDPLLSQNYAVPTLYNPAQAGST